MQGCKNVTWSLSAGGEDRAEDGHAKLDRRRLDPVGLKLAHPLADAGWQDFDHRQVTERGQDVTITLVGVGLPGGELHQVIGQPLLGDVAPETPTAPLQGPDASLQDLRLGSLPRLVGVPLVSKRAGRLTPAVDVPVVRGVTQFAIASDASA